MIFNFLLLIVLGVLILASYLDIKYKAIPSVILTGTIFLVLLLRPDNLLFGVISFVFAIMIKDFISDIAGMSFGVADIKIFVIIGLLLSNFASLMLMLIAFLIFQFVYTVVWRYKVDQKGEMAFVPCLTAVFITLMLLGGVA